MASTVLDSEIFADIFGSAEMRAIFSDENTIACYVRAEVALAIAQGTRRRDSARARRRDRREGAAGRARPRGVAQGSRERRLSDPRPRPAAVGQARRRRPLRPLGRDDAGHHGHRGRCCRSATGSRWSNAISARSRPRSQALAIKHRDTRWPAAPICSRPCRSPSATRRRSGCRWSIATPIRLRELRQRVLVAQLGGAAGTLASLGDSGLDVRQANTRASSISPSRRSPGTSRATASPRRCRCSA